MPTHERPLGVLMSNFGSPRAAGTPEIHGETRDTRTTGAATSAAPCKAAQTDFMREPIPRKVYLVAVLAGLSGLLYGFDSGAISGALPLLEGQFDLTASQTGLITSLLLYGALPSIVVSTIAARRFDRRQILLVGGVIFILGSLFCAIVSGPVGLMAARFFLGFGIGIANMFGLIYLSELAPTRVRGLLTGLYQLAVNVGILAAYAVGDIFHSTPDGWRWMLGLGVIPAVIFFVGMFIAPPSPRWLMMRGRSRDALNVLRTMRGGEEFAAKEIQEIEEVLDRPTKGLGGVLSDARKPLTILAILTFFQVWTGINAVVYYAPIIFKDVEGLGNNPGAVANYGVGTALVISTAIALPLIDKMGRVKMLAISMAGQAVAMVVLTFFAESGWIAVAAVFVYTFSFGFGLGPVFWLYVPEILPLQTRAIGTGAITFTQYLLNATFALVFPMLLAGMGPWIFMVFAVLSVAGTAYTVLRVPETKGRSLEEIEEEIFGEVKSLTDKQTAGSNS